MTTLRQAAQAVIEQWIGPGYGLPAAIDILGATLEDPEQEPVGYVFEHRDIIGTVIGEKGKWAPHEIPLYANPVEAPDIKALTKERDALLNKVDQILFEVDRLHYEIDAIPAIKEERDALLAAGRLAIQAMDNGYMGTHYASYRAAYAALKTAGAS